MCGFLLLLLLRLLQRPLEDEHDLARLLRRVRHERVHDLLRVTMRLRLGLGLGLGFGLGFRFALTLTLTLALACW